jgi:hypothetical protein
VTAPAVSDLLIVSGSSRVRTAAHVNHRIYADRIGVPYFFDLAPTTVTRIYMHKLDVIRRFLPLAEWLFWIDDDAFFTDFSIDLRGFLDGVGQHELVFCQSPVNPLGGWTWMSSGQLFIRRSPAMSALLDAVVATDLRAVKRWWRPDELGLFTNGDQDAFVYQLLGPDERWREAYLRLPWEAFNARPYHYERRLDERFLCHFAVPGGRPKAEVVAEFAARLGTTPALCAGELVEPYRVYLERSEAGPLLGVAPAAPKPGARRPPAGPVARARALAGRIVRGVARRLGVRRIGR